jgi:RND family efflux transporter MFP subunit
VQSLSKAGIAPDAEVDTLEAAFRVATARYETALEDARTRMAVLTERRAEYEIARKQLADATILAPFDGAVQLRLASVGEYVATGTPIVRLVKMDPLRLRLEVPEREALLVRLGQAVRVKVEGNTNVYAGRIARLSPAINELNRMLLVEADVPNGDNLPPGLFARAEIIVQEKEPGLAVPVQALLTFAGIEKVIVVSDGKALEKVVTTGRRGPDWVEILSGLSADEMVVLEPIGLRTGQPVSTADQETRTLAPQASNGLAVVP